MNKLFVVALLWQKHSGLQTETSLTQTEVSTMTENEAFAVSYKKEKASKRSHGLSLVEIKEVTVEQNQLDSEIYKRTICALWHLSGLHPNQTMYGSYRSLEENLFIALAELRDDDRHTTYDRDFISSEYVRVTSVTGEQVK